MQSPRNGTIKPLAAIALAAFALTLTACGSDGSGTPVAQSEPPAVDTGGASESEGAGENLALGKRAVTDFVDYGSKNEEPTKVAVSVLKVRKGRISDFKDFDLDADQRKAVPYYVDAKYENLGARALTRHLLSASIEDRSGQEYRPITLIVLSGTFKPCPESSDSKLKPRDSFTGCTPILLPKGKQFERVRFQGDVTKDPVFWRPQ
jgi:hypothetical protein